MAPRPRRARRPPRLVLDARRALPHEAVYRAAVRVVMRLVVRALFVSLLAWEREGGDEKHDGVHHLRTASAARGRAAVSAKTTGNLWGAVKALSSFTANAAAPFGDPAEGGSTSLHRSPARSADRHGEWRSRRSRVKGNGDREHPFRHQGSADVNTYKLFLEEAHALLRLGPGDSPEVTELETDIPADERYLPVRADQIERLSPRSLALLEIRHPRDLEVLEKIYAGSVLLGDDSPDGWGI